MFFYPCFAFLFLNCFLRTTAAASDSGDDFTNNLFSDLAPLLTLFGEQVAKQFLGQSMGWADNLIFAMGPLGIITAVVAAIRVGGPTWLRAIIGRAKESQGVAELELMSSTSASVCELWNGQAIVRVLGSPEIIELVYLERNDGVCGQNHPDSLSADVYSFEESKFCPSETDPLYHQKQKKRWRTDPEHNDDDGYELLNTSTHAFNSMDDIEDRIPNPCAPNISLNARGETASQGELWSVAIIGIIIQSAVITYWGLITKYGLWLTDFRKDGERAPVYAFPMSAVGTIGVVSGMLICSHVVEAATVEEKWKAKEDDKISVRFAWLQKGQIVNDEHFDSYAIFCLKDKQTIMTSRVRKDLKGFQSLVLLGTVISIFGFVAQFMGLRGMHWSATIAQLVATAIMCTLRAIIRRHLTRNPAAKKVVKNFELDCMAREIAKCQRFSVPSGKIEYGNTGVSNYYNLAGPIDGPNPFELPVLAENLLGRKLIDVRGRLKTISSWASSFHKEVSALCDAIEQTMEFISDPANQLTLVENQFESVPELSSGGPAMIQRDLDLTEFQWPLIVSVRGSDEDSDHFEKIEFNLKRRRPKEAGEQWGKWKVNRSEIEAAYSLCMLDFHELEMRSLYRYRGGRGPGQREDPESQDKTLRILGFKDGSIDPTYARCLYDWWISRETKCIEIKSKEDGTKENDISPFRVVGIMETPLDGSDSMLAVVSNTPLEKLCAQNIFSVFISSASALISSMPGKMSVRRYNKKNIGSFGVTHNIVEKFAQIVREAGLATLEEAYITIIPPLAEKLPPITEVQPDILQKIKNPMTSEAVKEDMLFWFSFTCHVSARSCTRTRKDLISYMLAANAYAKAAESCFLVLGEDHPRTHDATIELLRAIKIVVFKAEAHQFLVAEDDLPELRYWYLKIMDLLGAFYNSIPLDVAHSFSIANIKIMKLHQDVLGSWAVNSDSFHYEENRQFISDSPPALRWNLEQEKLKETWEKIEGNTIGNSDRQKWSEALSSARSSGYDAVSESLLENAPDTITLAVSMDYGSTASELFSYTGPSMTLQSDKCFMREFTMRSASHTFDVDSEDENGQTTLCRAIYFDHYHLVESLLETHGANVNKEDKNKRSPIFTAAILGYHSIFQLLLQRGAIPSSHHENGNTCLHVVASKDYLDILDILLDPSYSRVPVDPINDFGETPLHFAARGGYLASVHCLLRMGASVHSRNHIGQTPLAYAAASGHLEVVLALKERGADFEAVDNDGESIMQIATSYRHPHIVAALLERRTPPQWICVQVAANSGNDGTVELLLNYLLSVWLLMELSQRKFLKLFKSKDSAPYLQQPAKNSLLRIAAMQGASIDLAKFFLDQGANPFALDMNGNSALSLGVEQGDYDLMFLLVSSTMAINTDLNHLELPLRIAVERGDERALDILIYAGATVNDDQLIVLSTRLGHFDMTKRLFDLGLRLDNNAILDLLKTSIVEESTAILELFKAMAIPTQEFATQESSLHLAAELGKEKAVSALLSTGVKVDSYSYNNWTALQIAVKAGHLSTVKVLVDSGARISLRNRYGWSAISLARARQFREIEDYLASMQPTDPTDLDNSGSEIQGLEVADPWNSIFELDIGPQIVGNQEADLGFQLAPAVDAFPAQSFELQTNTLNQAYSPDRSAIRQAPQLLVETHDPPQVPQASDVAMATPSPTSDHEVSPQNQHSSSQQGVTTAISEYGVRNNQTI